MLCRIKKCRKYHHYFFIMQAVNEFRRRQVEVEELKKVIEQKSNQERNVDDKILSLYNEWEPKLNQLVETISSKFSDFMESISYVGEVVLSRKEKVYLFLCFMDISYFNYTLNIEYRFFFHSRMISIHTAFK